MKRIIAIIAALAMTISLVACEEVTFPDIDTLFADTPAGESGEKISLKFKLDEIGEPSVPEPSDIPDGEPRVISITLDEKVIITELGRTARITYTVKPPTAYDKSVYYESSDDSIVKVDKDGYVLGLKPGAATVTVHTNDMDFRRTCTVIVHHNNGDSDKSARLVELINSARIENGCEPTSDANISLRAAANQRAYEEAVDMVNYGDTRMDDKRMQETDGKREEMELSIFDSYGIWSRASKAVYVWGEYTAEQAYRAFIEDDECAEALGVRGGEGEPFDYIAAGYYEFDGITYWSILMTSE